MNHESGCNKSQHVFIFYPMARLFLSVGIIVKNGYCWSLCVYCCDSLIPRPPPDFISQPWLRDKIWEWPGDEAIVVTDTSYVAELVCIVILCDS